MHPVAWAERWRAVVDRRRFARRVVQGRQFQRAGRVSDVRATSGLLSGRVQGGRVTPYLVEIAVSTLDAAQWDQVVEALAGQVRHSARLLGGLEPEGLDAELAAAGIALFPDGDELDVTCACGDALGFCAHAAGVWEAAARQLESDPFLLLRLRGRGRERLLADIVGARRRTGVPKRPDGLLVDSLPVADWTSARTRLEDLHLPVLNAPTTPAAPLKLLGDPPAWAGGVSAWDLFRPLVERAAAYAQAFEASPLGQPDDDDTTR